MARMPEAQPSLNQADASSKITVKLVQGSQPSLEASLHTLFAAAADQTPDPRQLAVTAARLMGRGGSVTLEAERGAWSRYRVAVRVQGMPVTIATVELTQVV